MANPPRSFKICQTCSNIRRELGLIPRPLPNPIDGGPLGRLDWRGGAVHCQTRAIPNAEAYPRRHTSYKQGSISYCHPNEDSRSRNLPGKGISSISSAHEPKSSLVSMVNPTDNPQITYSHRPRRSRWTSSEPSALRALKSGRLASVISEITIKAINGSSQVMRGRRKRELDEPMIAVVCAPFAGEGTGKTR